MNEFEKLCEKFGVIETKKRLVYPRQIKFSESFINALKDEFLKQLQEDTAPIKDRVAKFTKAVMFYLHDLNNTHGQVGLAERKQFSSNAKHNYRMKLRAKSKILDALRRKEKEQLTQEPSLKKECNEFNVIVKGEKQEGNKKIDLKKTQKRRKEIEKENINLK